jgi:hypothetical protein
MFSHWADETGPSSDDYYYRYNEVVRESDTIREELKNKTNELNVLKNLVKEYLKLGSCDGRIDRRDLRRNLATHIGEKWDEAGQRIK